MSYYFDAEKVSLDDLQKRMEETDLVPSRSLLLENIGKNFRTLKKKGYATLADLRKELKKSKNIPSISEKTGISTKYLTLLRREIESYFPKAYPVSAFNWIPPEDMGKLEIHGYKNTALLFEALNSPENRTKISADLEINAAIIDELSRVVDLTRIQWVSPVTAKMLISAGYDDVESVARADPEKMCDEVDGVNKENNFFKGKIGLRDIKRVVKAASYV